MQFIHGLTGVIAVMHIRQLVAVLITKKFTANFKHI